MDPFLQATVAKNRNYIPTRSIPISYPPSNQQCENAIQTPEGTLNLYKEWSIPFIIPKFAIECHISIGFIQSNDDLSRSLLKHTSINPLSTLSDNSIDHIVLPNAKIIEEESLNFNQHNNHKSPGVNLYSSHSTSTVQSLKENRHKHNHHHFNNIHLRKSSSTATDNHYHRHSSFSSSPSSFFSNTSDISRHDTQKTIGIHRNNSNEDISSLTLTTTSSSTGSFSSLFNGSWRQNYLHHHYHFQRPKNTMSKLKSSLIENVQINDKLSKIIANRYPNDPFIFYNKGACFLWVDHQTQDYLTCITFSRTFPTCHDINKLTLSNDRVDLLIGFSTGDCIWYDPLCNRYTRFNKHGILNYSKVTCVKWVPNSENLFIISFENGVILVMDKGREDQQYILQPAQESDIPRLIINKPHNNSKYNPVSHWQINQKSITDFKFSNNGLLIAIVGSDGILRIIDFLQERLVDIFSGYFGKLLCVTWSPDDKYLLTGGQDDLVTIWSFMEHRIVARCQGHKSWVTGVAFDAKKCYENIYRFASVGEDCKIILWDYSTTTLHKPKKFKHSAPLINSGKGSSRKGLSQLSNIWQLHNEKDEKNKNNNQEEHSDEDDSGIIIQRLHKNKLNLGSNGHKQLGNDNNRRAYTKPSIQQLKMSKEEISLPTVHPLIDKTHVPLLQPLVVRTIHADPCIDIIFTHNNNNNTIFTSDRKGCVKHWCI